MIAVCTTRLRYLKFDSDNDSDSDSQIPQSRVHSSQLSVLLSCLLERNNVRILALSSKDNLGVDWVENVDNGSLKGFPHSDNGTIFFVQL